MTTLQKFKILATQCAVAGSPKRSPTTSPVIQLRRRKTLRMLLTGSSSSSNGRSRGFSCRGCDSPDREVKNSPEKGKDIVASHKLKDLFVSSPPLEEKASSDGRIRDGGEEEEDEEEAEEQRFLQAAACGGGGVGLGVAGRGSGARSLRPLSAAFRQRLLLRRAWRPVLVTIPE